MCPPYLPTLIQTSPKPTLSQGSPVYSTLSIIATIHTRSCSLVHFSHTWHLQVTLEDQLNISQSFFYNYELIEMLTISTHTSFCL